MKIKYKFANEIVEIEVDDTWGNVLIDYDRQEYNNDQTETRRHTTLDNHDDGGAWLAVEDTAITALFADEGDEHCINRAIEALKPKQQELVRTIYFDGVSVNDYAAREGVDQSAISHRLQTVYKNLKKLL